MMQPLREIKNVLHLVKCVKISLNINLTDIVSRNVY